MGSPQGGGWERSCNKQPTRAVKPTASTTIPQMWERPRSRDRPDTKVPPTLVVRSSKTEKRREDLPLPALFSLGENYLRRYFMAITNVMLPYFRLIRNM